VIVEYSQDGCCTTCGDYFKVICLECGRCPACCPGTAGCRKPEKEVDPDPGGEVDSD